MFPFPLAPHFSGFTRLHFFFLHLFLTTFCFLSFLFFPFVFCFLLDLCREESFYCTVPITPVKREVEELDKIEEVSRVAQLDVHGLPCQSTRVCQFEMLFFDQNCNKDVALWLGCTVCSDSK